MRPSEGKVGGDPGGGRAAQTHGGETKRSVRRGGRKAKWRKDRRGRESEPTRLSDVNSFSKEQWHEAVGVSENRDGGKEEKNSILFMSVAAIRLAAKHLMCRPSR